MAEPTCETCWAMTQFYAKPQRAPLCPWCQGSRVDAAAPTPDQRRRAACRRGAANRTPGAASRASNATFFGDRTGT